MRIARGLAAAAAGVVLLGGCALLEEPDKKADEPSSSESPTEDEPEVRVADIDVDTPPQAFSVDASTQFPEQQVYDGLVAGDHVLTMALDRLRARSLPDLSSAWELTPNGLFVDIMMADEHLYTLESSMQEGAGTEVGRISLSVRRVDPESGSVVDEASLEVSNDVQSPGKPVTVIAGVLGDVVLVESWGDEEGGRHTLTAVDLTSGEKAWERRPGTLIAAEDELAVVSSAVAGTPGELVGLAVDSGSRKWRALQQLITAEPVGVLDDDLILVKEDSIFSIPTLVEVSLEDGDVSVLQTVDDVDWSCSEADETRVVCSMPGEKALGFDLDKRQILWRLPTERRYGVWVTSVNQNMAYGFTSGGKPVILDAATGKDVTSDPGASPQSTNGYGGLVLYAGQAFFYPTTEVAVSEDSSEEPSEDSSEEPSEDSSEEPSEDASSS